MMRNKELNIPEINMAVKEHIKGCKTCIMGTLDANNNVYLSSLPVALENNVFYAYVSRTAPHFDHLKLNNNVQVIFVEDELKMKNSFLRKRINFSCTVSFIADDEEIFTKLENVHGETVKVLRTLDFELIELKISSGKAIFGAGQAYFLDANCEFSKQDTGKKGS